MSAKFMVAVIGGHDCSKQQASLAEKVGGIIAGEGAVLVTGGLGGIMEAASRGASEAGGVTVGIIPGENKKDANDSSDIVVPTGMGNSRNALVAASADMLVAFPGKYGTLSEIAFALNAGKPVYGLNTWDIEGVIELSSTEDLGGEIKRRMASKK
jgi:uncharacterized protein (TIGR00725 family)